jgi:hypothetical protein
VKREEGGESRNIWKARGGKWMCERKEGEEKRITKEIFKGTRKKEVGGRER